jgi:uncharacterized ferritin-like protein (DUF455 family)
VTSTEPQSVHEVAERCLRKCLPEEKCASTQQLRARWEAGALSSLPTVVQRVEVPGRPERPELVRPRQLKKRKLHLPEGRAVLIHALAHIEFNAINLALDAVYRFQQMPPEFISDWLRVAAEEATHFQLLRERLRAYGFDYGDFPAHNGLWAMACKTDLDVLDRMALVPRVMEARGLDVTPAMIEKLDALGDPETADVLRIIWRDELTHVEVGNRWFQELCRQRQVAPDATFHRLVEQHMPGGLRGPFHLEARRRAGFSETELAYLQTLEATPGPAC